MLSDAMRVFLPFLITVSPQRLSPFAFLNSMPPTKYPFDHNVTKSHCNFAYSALAAMRMGMSLSASFQSVRKS